MTPADKAWQLARQVRTWRPKRPLDQASTAGWRRDQFKQALRRAGIHWSSLGSELSAMLDEATGDIRTNPRR